MKSKLSKTIGLIIIIMFSLGFIQFIPEVDNATTIFFTLTVRVPNSNVRAIDCMYLVKQQLARIGLNLQVLIVEDPWPFLDIPDLIEYDLRYIEYDDLTLSEMINSLYTENGSRNIFGYDITMDYIEELGTGRNEWLIKDFNSIIPPNSQERYIICWEWQNYLMNNILPCIPLYCGLDYIVYWNNLAGYNYADGLLQSWGKMSWNTIHPEQISTNEIVVADSSWIDLNPLIYSENRGSADKFINDLILDSLIVKDSDHTYWPHLAQSWEYIADNQIRFTLREDIYWQDYFTFTDELFDADDVYFSLFMSKLGGTNDWINSITKVDSKTVDVFLNYYNCIDDITQFKILPEYYLNQTQELDGVTPDITHPSWTDYRNNCFGTGLFMLDDFTEGVETILLVNEDCWKLDSTVTNDPALDFERRFGDFSGGLNKLTIMIIPNYYEQELEFEAGKIDFFDVSGFYIDKRDQYLADSTKDLQTKATPNLSILAFNMRETRPNIGNRDLSPLDPSMSIGLVIRKAISYAINRQEIKQIIHNNEMITSDHPISPYFEEWLNPNIVKYNFDLDKARESLIKAGFEGYCPHFTPGINSYSYFSVVVGIGLLLVSSLFLNKKRKHMKGDQSGV
ncbi:MAG: hypothetical protein FK733_12155 [Asgard group archaeon]|nr:hypothetical protein [Asgard group archaeon]